MKPHAPVQRVHGNLACFEAERMAVKVDRAGIHESHHGQGLVTQNGQMKWTAWSLKYHPTGMRYRIDDVEYQG